MGAVRRLADVPGWPMSVSMGCEGRCFGRAYIIEARNTPPWPLDLDIVEAFERGRFRCAECGRRCQHLTVRKDIVGRDGDVVLNLRLPAPTPSS